MPTLHTISLTNKQENALTDLVAAYNAPLLAQTPPGVTLTNDQYLLQVVVAPAITTMETSAAAVIIGTLHARMNAAAAASDKATLNKINNDLTTGGY